MEKTVAELVDELSITNVKLYHLEELVEQDRHTRETATQIKRLNRQRNRLKTALAEYFGQAPDIKVEAPGA